MTTKFGLYDQSFIKTVREGLEDSLTVFIKYSEYFFDHSGHYFKGGRSMAALKKPKGIKKNKLVFIVSLLLVFIIPLPRFL